MRTLAILIMTVVLHLPMQGMGLKSDTASILNSDIREPIPVESWMSENTYLASAEPIQMEAWMMSETYLEKTAETLELDAWMFDGDYLQPDLFPVEEWMTDPEYLSK